MTDIKTTVVFDLGGVLIDWNPRYLFRKILPDESAVEDFLDNICTEAWNYKLDQGRSWQEGIDELVAQHPQHRDVIEAYWHRWPETLGDTIDETLRLFMQLHEQGTRLFALTNWSHETFPHALEKFDFFSRFEGVVVSGEIGITKPSPEIYQHLLTRFNLSPSDIVFIDDREENVRGAEALGISSHQYVSADGLHRFLCQHGLLSDNNST